MLIAFFYVSFNSLLLNRNYPILPTVSEVEDDDVATERSKVLGGHCNNAVLRMESLTKVNYLDNLRHFWNTSIIMIYDGLDYY